ncbi:MAG: hypothetical protein ACO3ND_01635 [Opitutales bacterium]
MLKPSANLNSDFQGTAAELAAYVAQELHRLGFSPRFYPNERLVRYYAWEQLLERPEPSLEGDRRRKLFNGRQAMRLLAARILSERGSDLESIRRRLKAAAVEKRGLDDLIDEVASVQALEGRDETEPPPLAEINEEQEFSARRMRSVENFSAMHVEPGVTEFRPLFNKAFPQRGSHSSPGSKLRRISESSSPGLAFRKMVMLESTREDISEEARSLYRQLLAFHPADKSEPPKRERWSKLRLAPWCEVLLRIDEKQRPDRSEIDSIVSNFRKSLEDNYMQ